MRTFVVAGFAVTLGLVVFFSSKDKSLKKSDPIETQRAPASTPPAPKEKTSSAKQSDLKEIQRIENCYRTNTCDYPQTDARSYGIAVGHALADKLTLFHSQYGQEPSAQKEMEQLARRAFKVEDGFVQNIALDMFKDIPISKENLEVLGEGLQNNTDPTVAEKALTELQRYINTPEEEQMQSIVRNLISTGPHFSSQKVGENILGFINDRSYPSYQALQRQLPSQSRVARDLAGALREYHRQRTGG